jgi:nitrite reductase/ring-hydroxylating ferredoxin subunit
LRISTRKRDACLDGFEGLSRCPNRTGFFLPARSGPRRLPRIGDPALTLPRRCAYFTPAITAGFPTGRYWLAMDKRRRRTDANLGFHQNWYAVMLASDLGHGQVVGADFLGTRVAAYRTEDGAPAVLDARCAHLGADLSRGELVAGDLQCRFHHFRYRADGRCTWVPAGCAVPRTARVFSYPTVETLGIIWAFNGSEPLYEPPEFAGEELEPLIAEARAGAEVGCEPFVLISGSYDYVRLKELRGLDIDLGPRDIRQLNPYVIETDVHWEGPEFGRQRVRTRTWGTNTMLIRGDARGRTDLAGVTSTPVRPGLTAVYRFVAVPDTDDGTTETAAAIGRHLAAEWQWLDAVTSDDLRAYDGMQFRDGALIAADKPLARWLRFAREFPRAVPGHEPASV